MEAHECALSSLKRFTGMADHTLHVPWHVPLFPIRSSESQGFSLDFGQHVSSAGLSWRLRTARRDTWMWEADVRSNAARSVPNVICCSLFVFPLSLCVLIIGPSSEVRSLILTIQTFSKRPSCIADVSVCSS